jgi:hypothetical protein
MGLAVSAPNYITDCSFIYNVFSLSNLQLKSHISKLHKQVNNTSLLGRITRIKSLHLQTVEWLPASPLSNWPHDYVGRFRHNLLAATLSIMKTHQFAFSSRNIDNNLIVGGSFPIVDILGSKYLHTATLYNLKRMMIMFLSQLTSCDGDMLVKWHTSNTPPLAPVCKLTPTWYKQLSRIVLQSPLTSQRLLSQYCTSLKPMPITINLPDLQRIHKSNWVAIHNSALNSVIIGRIRFKNLLIIRF